MNGGKILVCEECGPEGEHHRLQVPMQLIGNPTVPCAKCKAPVGRENWRLITDELPGPVTPAPPPAPLMPSLSVEVKRVDDIVIPPIESAADLRKVLLEVHRSFRHARMSDPIVRDFRMFFKAFLGKWRLI